MDNRLSSYRVYPKGIANRLLTDELDRKIASAPEWCVCCQTHRANVASDLCSECSSEVGELNRMGYEPRLDRNV